MDTTTLERAALTARLERLDADYHAAAAAYEDYLHAPSGKDRSQLRAWRRRLDELYAAMDGLAARRRAARRLLRGVGSPLAPEPWWPGLATPLAR